MAGIPRAHRLLLVATAAFWLGAQATAQAGMSVLTLTDVAKARLDVLSFFVVGYLLLAWAVKGLWNHLAKGFPKLPRLNYRRALSLLLVAGLFMYVILTMISGARELLTPGAWEKKGIHYELKGAKAPDENTRREGIGTLKIALMDYAAKHDGAFPDTQFGGAIPQDFWQLPGGIGTYNYVPGWKTSDGRELLAYEPTQAAWRGGRFVLLADGEIETWNDEQIMEALGMK